MKRITYAETSTEQNHYDSSRPSTPSISVPPPITLSSLIHNAINYLLTVLLTCTELQRGSQCN